MHCSNQQDLFVCLRSAAVLGQQDFRLACRRSAAVFRSARHQACLSEKSCSIQVSRILGLLVGEVLQHSGQQDIGLACRNSVGVQVSRTLGLLVREVLQYSGQQDIGLLVGVVLVFRSARH